MDSLKALQSNHPWIQDVRGKGLMLGIELAEQQADKGQVIFQRLLEAGFIVNYRPHAATFLLFPPYVISTSEIDRFLRAFEGILKKAV